MLQHRSRKKNAFPCALATTDALRRTRPLPAPPLTNTSTPLAQLVRRSTALLLENAWLETARPVALPIPDHLRAQYRRRSLAKGAGADILGERRHPARLIQR